MNSNDIERPAQPVSNQSAWRNTAAEQGQRATPFEVVVAAVLLVLGFIISTVPVWGILIVVYLVLRWFGINIP